MRKVVFSPESAEDLENIWLYIAQDSPLRADSFLDKLYKLFRESLAVFPEIGTERDYLDEGVLAFPFRNYMVYYRYDQEKTEILRILYGSRDLPIIFQ